VSNSNPLTETEYALLVAAIPQTQFGSQEKFMQGKVQVEMLPEGYIRLNQELATGLHPKLEKLLANHPIDEVDIKLAEICMYCKVILDGTYTLAERDKLCYILAGRLEVLRELAPPEILLN
jgi:hypothetical protein